MKYVDKIQAGQKKKRIYGKELNPPFRRVMEWPDIPQKMTLLALKGEASSFCNVWIVCGSIPQQTKPYRVQNALKGGVWTLLQIKNALQRKKIP
jgi:hypothetical protein